MAIAVVQSAIGSGNTNFSLTLKSAPTAGNLLVAIYTSTDSGYTSAMSGWTFAIYSNGYYAIAIYYKTASGASDQTISVSSTSQYGTLGVYEISGLSSAALDVSVSNGNGTLNASNQYSTGTTSSTTSANEIAIAAFTGQPTSVSWAGTPLSGGTFATMTAITKVLSSIGTQSATATYPSSSDVPNAALVTFKGSSTPITTTTTLTKSTAYAVKSTHSLTKPTDYKVLTKSTKTLGMAYQVGTVVNYSREATASLPTGDADLSTIYTSTEKTDVATANQTYVSADGINAEYVIHQFKVTDAGGTTSDAITLHWYGKTNIAPSVKAVHMQVYNNTTSAWDTVASNTTAAADTEFALDASITANTSDYYAGTNNEVAVRVYQDA